MVLLSELARAFDASIQLDVQISSVVSQTSRVTPACAFAALAGARVHGAAFADAALQAGASAIITDPEGAEILNRSDVPMLVLPDLSRRLGELCNIVNGNVADSLNMFAITGTNGKTTTSYMLADLLRTAGRNVGLIGGVEIATAARSQPATLTTPMADEVQELLAEHARSGGTDVVMEVTSHALEQHRVGGIRFAVAGFTNLTQDHLDYHESMQAYFDAKAQLFSAEYAAAAVILIDDEWGMKLFENARAARPNVFALTFRDQLDSHVPGWQARVLDDGSGCELIDANGQRMGFQVSLPGTFNLHNAALAVCMALVGGVDPLQLPRNIATVVPGRMQVISDSSPRVIVDFAHNAAALELALTASRANCHGDLIVVTGSAGDRDADKRFEMGRIAATLADVVIITDDDPHGEPAERIREALMKGAVTGTAHVREIGNRTEAIHEAISSAHDADTVLIAGRGHETIQEIGDVQHVLDDRVVARQAIDRRNQLR